MRVRIFNPSHDECLASGSPFYTPSKTARMMDEVILPGWQRLDDPMPRWEDVEELEVWGWDARIVHQLRKRGCPEHLLPSDQQLEKIRELSSRQTAVEILPLLPGGFQSWWLRNAAEIKNFFSDENTRFSAKEKFLFKSPWSCSGRGVFSYHPDRINKVLREQGGIEVEPLYPRVADFAMEFSCREGQVHFLGLSAMMNAGYHGGNLVMEDDEILSLMTNFVSTAEVSAVRQSLTEVLTQKIAPHYNGPLGVDQMIVRQTNGYALHPCVEINLRHTMGHIAIEQRFCKTHLAKNTDFAQKAPL